VFLAVDAPAWVDAFNIWALLHAPTLAGQLWSIDGKSIKCTAVGGNSHEQNFATLVSVYGQPAGVVQLELMDNAKVSEIAVANRWLETVTTAPSLAQSLPLAFSLDALHAQVETLTFLDSREAGYLVGLKANQKQLYQQMQQLAQQTLPLSQTTPTETLHGRHTQRTVKVYAAPANLPKRWLKTGITRIV
jgi:hypothetical protein